MEHKNLSLDVPILSLPLSKQNVSENISVQPNKDAMKVEKFELFRCIIEQMEGDVSNSSYTECCIWLDGGLFYKGNIKNCKLHGLGVIIWPDKTEYHGELIENCVHGSGTFLWPDGSSYTGSLVYGIPHGYGVYKCGDKTYCGLWEKGKCHGKGIFYYDASGKSFYDGDWFENKQQGFAIRRYKNGNTYKGQFVDNKRHGTGTMFWYNIRQEYTGEWYNDNQTGQGTYTWYFNRTLSSQYPLRNHYVGDFLNGCKHGIGTFHYANGAFYEGEWKNDMKHGHGKFVFKNGCMFTGEFQENRVKEFPDLILSGMATPDLAQRRLPVVSPLRSRPQSSNKTNSIFFDIDILDLLFELNADENDSIIESKRITDTLLRYFSQIKQIYRLYSGVGCEHSCDNTYILSNIQFCRFLKDYRLHTNEVSISDIARYIHKKGDLNDPYGQILFKDFLNYIVKISHLLYKERFVSNIFSSCFEELMTCLTKNLFAKISGYAFVNNTKAIEASQYLNKCKEIYIYFSDRSFNLLTVHHVIKIFKELRLLNKSLTCSKLVSIIRSEDEEDSVLNIDKKVCFLEFFEIFVGCATVFQTDSIQCNKSFDEPSLTVAKDSDLTIKCTPDEKNSSDGNEEIWSANLKKFFNQYLFPAFNKRKTVDEISKSANCFQIVEVNLVF